MPSPFRQLPSLNELLESPQLKSLVDRVNRNSAVAGVRQFLENVSQDVQSAWNSAKIPTPQELAQRIADWISTQERAGLQSVINATGIVLPPRAGGAPLADEALEAMGKIGANYVAGELAPDDPLGNWVRDLLIKLTGAESALVLHSHSAAMAAAVAAHAAGKEVIIARSQLGAWEGDQRLADLATACGATLREVGVINRAATADYQTALGPQTAAILRAFPVNFMIVGAVTEVSLADLLALSRSRGVALWADLPGGSILDLSKYGLSNVPTVAAMIQGGADLVFFPGEQLVGGPECGIIVGKHALIQRIREHALGSAMLATKTILAGLGATLEQTTSLDTAELKLPLLTLIATSVENLKNRAERLAPQLAAASRVASATAVADSISLRGAEVPGQTLPTWCVEVQPKSGNAEQLAAALRTATPSVLVRIVNDRVRIDLRSVLPRQDMQIATAFGVLPPAVSNNESDAE